MIPDVKLNGKSVREMGWIRENIDFPESTVPNEYNRCSGKKFSNPIYRSVRKGIVSATEFYHCSVNARYQKAI